MFGARNGNGSTPCWERFLTYIKVPITPKIIFIPRNIYIFLSRMAKKIFFLVEAAMFYGPPKLGLFSPRPSELETGLVTSFQAYLTRFYYLVTFRRIRHILWRKNIYSVFMVISIVWFQKISIPPPPTNVWSLEIPRGRGANRQKFPRGSGVSI